MILLDTNAILWILAEHRRARPLLNPEGRLFISPVSLLEMKFLVEVGRLQEAPGRAVRSLSHDPRWQLDNPTAEQLFDAALEVDWTRDPFDRLLTAHAVHRQWRLATGDRHIQAHLPETGLLAL